MTVQTAVVTGASGFIGSALCARLAAEGVRTYGMVRSRRRARVPAMSDAGVRIIENPTFDVDAVAFLFRQLSPDVVFHLAAYGVSPARRDPLGVIEGNLTLTAQLLLSAQAANVPRFIHTGSCHEYGGPAAFDGTRERLREDDVLAPLSTYGAAKAASVLHATAYARAHRMNCCTLRLFGAFGPSESPERLIPYLVERLRKDEVVDLTSGAQVRDLLHVDDVVAAYLAAAETELRPAAIYNVCSGKGAAVRDVAEAVADIMGKPRSCLAFGKRPSRDDEAHWIVGNPNEFMSATGWRPTLSLQEGMRRTVEALLDHEKMAAAA